MKKIPTFFGNLQLSKKVKLTDEEQKIFIILNGKHLLKTD